MSYGHVPQYVTEDQEQSDSDCQSDEHVMQHVTADFTELYRRKHQALNHSRNSAGTYYQPHMQGYYEQPQAARPPTNCACNVPPDPRYCYYKAQQTQEGMFRSSTHITPNLKTCPDTKPASANSPKRYPITARTPRYYRCTPSQLCKRPSTLCLPVTCQPDPAVYHRPRKAPPEVQHYRGQEAAFAFNDYLMRTTAVKRTDTRPVDSEGDVNSRLNDLENFLTKFDDDDEDGEMEQLEITGVSDISKILKPKVPNSIKAQQDKIVKLRAVKTNLTETIATSEKLNKLEVKEVPDEPLDKLLQKLHKDVTKGRDEKRETNDNKNVSKAKPQTDSKQRHSFCLDLKPPLDDTSALELHKSKSYIVSLIDKALSKELGTIPGDKCTTKEFLNMTPKKAMDLVNRHSASSTKDYERQSLSLDVAQADIARKENQCPCKTEEPLYLRQLKQLRWSHLRHIQREAKRLADLERFLDSFSEGENAS